MRYHLKLELIWQIDGWMDEWTNELSKMYEYTRHVCLYLYAGCERKIICIVDVIKIQSDTHSQSNGI